MAWRFHVYDPAGALIEADVDGVNLVGIAWEVNAPDECAITFPKYSPVAAAFEEGNEVHVVDDEPDPNVTRFQGPMLGGATSSGRSDVEVDARGLQWYFEQLDLDAMPLQYLTNGSFETGDETDWDAVGVTSVVGSGRRRRGTYALRLDQASAGVDTFERQVNEITATGIGLQIVLVAWCWIDPGSWVGPATEARGLFLAGFDAGTDDLVAFSFARITNTTPRGRWLRLTTQLQMPPDAVWNVEARLYAPGGVIFWDDAQILAPGSVSTATLTGNAVDEADLALFAELIVQFEQGAMNPGDPTKPDHNIGTDCPESGTGIVRHYQWAEHHAVTEFFEEVTSRSDGFDIEVDSADRTFKTHTPQQGEDLSDDITFDLTNIISYDMRSSIASSETWVTYQGAGEGLTREQGFAVDFGEIEAIALQAVREAPRAATAETLDRLADKRVDRYKRVGKFAGLVVPYEWIDQVHKGDIVTVDIDDGWVQLSGRWRIVRIELDGRTRLLTLVMNKIGGIIE